jgi:hypothetical protein
MSRLSKDEILAKSPPFFGRRPEIRFVYLFGSVAKGIQNKLSDVDLGVFVDSSTLSSKLHPYGFRAYLITELMELLKSDRVDVVILNEASPLLRFQVVRYGLPIYERDRPERIQFQASAFCRYFDLLPLLKVHYSNRLFA